MLYSSKNRKSFIDNKMCNTISNLINDISVPLASLMGSNLHSNHKKKRKTKGSFHRNKEGSVHSQNEKQEKPASKKFILKKNSFGKVEIQTKEFQAKFEAKKPTSPELRRLSSCVVKGISDIKYKYEPDFGYKEHIEFSSRPSGWAFLADIINKYPKRQRMMNIH